MKCFYNPIFIAFCTVVLITGWAIAIDPCATVRCAFGTVCVAVEGGARCVPGPCTSNEECPDNQACTSVFSHDEENKTCTDLCVLIDCPAGTNCMVIDHQGSCKETPPCQSEKDCPDNQDCFQLNGESPQACNDPCIKVKCDDDSICIASGHQGVCTKISCSSDDECDDDEACFGATWDASPDCNNPCMFARCANCTPYNHQANCP